LSELQVIGHRARNFYQERLGLEVGAGRFGAIFEALANHARG